MGCCTKTRRLAVPYRPLIRRGIFRCAILLVAMAIAPLQSASGQPPGADARSASDSPTVTAFGAVGDGENDDTAAIQRAVDAGRGELRFPKGIFRIVEPIEIDLQRVGFTSISGGGVARIVMDGPGPAFRFVGSHAGTAAPATVEENVWRQQRTPTVVGLEIVGAHEQACGIEARGTMQLTLTRLVVRDALHAVHLVDRNRNVILSECHLYNNRGIGVFMDRLNLHQINIANCHISYNQAGGVVARQSEIRNLQIGTCDIEGNMGTLTDPPTANVWLDSTDSSIGEVAIVGCTIQHAHDAKDSANIRINGRSAAVPFTEERRHGHITISDNILSDVQTNIELTDVRGATISGNTIWKGYEQNLVVRGSKDVVLSGNVFDRNPRYHYGDGAEAKLGALFEDSADCTLNGNHFSGVVHAEAAVIMRRCRRFNITNCTIIDYGAAGLLLDDVSASRVSDCLISDDRAEADGEPLKQRKLRNCQIIDNLFTDKQE